MLGKPSVEDGFVLGGFVSYFCHSKGQRGVSFWFCRGLGVERAVGELCGDLQEVMRTVAPRVGGGVFIFCLDSLLREGFKHYAEQRLAVVTFVHLAPRVEEGAHGGNVVMFSVRGVEVFDWKALPPDLRAEDVIEPVVGGPRQGVPGDDLLIEIDGGELLEYVYIGGSILDGAGIHQVDVKGRLTWLSVEFNCFEVDCVYAACCSSLPANDKNRKFFRHRGGDTVYSCKDSFKFVELKFEVYNIVLAIVLLWIYLIGSLESDAEIVACASDGPEDICVF